VIPCSGVGKVHGLISRESAYLAVDEVAPERLDVVCLALVVREDEETLAKVQAYPCITIDGCGKACAQKNVELAGGQVAAALQVAKLLSAHRGTQPGTGSDLTEDGWAIVREIAEEVAQEAERYASAPPLPGRAGQ
jgi:uncharacterized metal-binding protein